MTLRITLATHVGHVRNHNEDTVWATGFSVTCEAVVRIGQIPRIGSAALLADGMGGHSAGEVASRLAVEILRPAASTLLSPTAVTNAINAANEGLFVAMDVDPRLDAMGTTIVGVAFGSEQVCVFNVGDSRAYLHSKGRLVRLSTDHIERDHVLTQCLGGFTRGDVKPSCRTIPPLHANRMLLCSDGLTDLVTDDEIDAILANKQINAGAALIDAALSAGGHDNVSVIIIDAD